MATLKWNQSKYRQPSPIAVPNNYDAVRERIRMTTVEWENRFKAHKEEVSELLEAKYEERIADLEKKIKLMRQRLKTSPGSVGPQNP